MGERGGVGSGKSERPKRPNIKILKLNLYLFFYNPKVHNATTRDNDRKRHRDKSIILLQLAFCMLCICNYSWKISNYILACSNFSYSYFSLVFSGFHL